MIRMLRARFALYTKEMRVCAVGYSAKGACTKLQIEYRGETWPHINITYGIDLYDRSISYMF
jgi:hypothetical protein